MSVVVPTRGDTATLTGAVRSVLRQTVDVEVVIVAFSGSEERTARLVGSWNDPRVRSTLAPPAADVASARNAGVVRARSHVLAFLDETDLWFGPKLASQLAAMGASASSWSYGSALLFSEGRTLEALLPAPPTEELIERLPYANAVPGGGSNVLVTRDAFEEVGGFDPSVPHLEDWDLWIRLAQQSLPAVTAATVVACRHGSVASHTRLGEILRSARTLDDRYRSLRGGQPLDWADLHRWLCHDALRFGPRSVALRLALSSLRQRHEGGGELALRSLLPARRRPPVGSLDEVSRWIDRRFRPRVVGWPDGTEAELISLLAAGEDLT